MRDTGHRDKQGFTLAEMLLTIGIMVILAGISFVGLIHYQRKLKLLEMDGTAEELFMAAQNEMSTLEANGTLELLSEEDLGLSISNSSDEFEADGDSESAAGHRCYALIHNAGDGESSDGSGLLSYLLPFGVIDDTVRTDGSYRIEYDYTAKTVTAVYYSKAASFLSGAGDAYAFKADGSDAAALKKAAGDANLRQHFDGSENEAAGGAIVGYYGGDSKAVPEGSITAPVLSIENGARLLLHIRMPEENKNVNTILYIKGKNSGAELTASLGDLSAVVSSTLTRTSFTAEDGNSAGSSLYMARLRTNAGKDREYLLSLDSVTEQSSHFAELFPALQPGEDIEIYVKCSSNDGYALEVKSNTVSANSLFASVETETVSNAWFFDSSGMGSLKESGAETVPTAMIANVRHLENLDPTVSGLSVNTSNEYCIQAAVQTGDLIYAPTSPVTDYDGQAVETASTFNTADAFSSEISEYNSAADISIYDLNCGVSTGYRPIQNEALLSYDGKGNAMLNFASGTAVKLTNEDCRGQGIFAGISGQKDAKPVSIRDLRILNGKFSNTDAASAGALIGVVGNSHQLILQDIEIENCQLSSEGNAGGLIGTVEADGTDSAAVRLYVHECGVLGEYGSVSGSNAGGLIGSLIGSAETKISGSTASVYVTASSNAGGFIGVISGQAEIRFSYVGGHTKDGKYPEDSTEGAAAQEGQGRWNVQSAGNAGGFIGAANSVQLELLGCYTTASVQSAGSADAFLAAVGGSGSESASYCYAAGKVSGSSQLAETVKNLAAEGKDYKGTFYAKPYDDALKTGNANPQYPYMTTAELFDAAVQDSALNEISSGSRSLKYGGKHIGDFCVEAGLTNETILRFVNGPRFYAEVFTPLKEDTNYMSMLLKDEDGSTDTYSFTATKNSDGSFTLNRTKGVNSGEHSDYDSVYSVNVGGTDYLVYRILLDDISVANEHFSENSKNLRVGSAITGYAVSEENPADGWFEDTEYLSNAVDGNTVAQLLTAANTDLTASVQNLTEQYRTAGEENTTAYDTDNGLFGRNSSFGSGQANILSIRHLENLDHYVSYLENPSEKRTADDGFTLAASGYSKAVQQADLDWNQYLSAVKRGDGTPAIYRPKSNTAITDDGYFYGIQNLLLTEYDGGNHSISNLRIAADKNDWNSAGLFAAVSGKQQAGFTIRRLRLRSTGSTTSTKKSGGKNSAAALVGYLGSTKGLTIQNVVIEGAEVQSVMDAGGLVGYSDGGSLTISNTAVYEGERQNPYRLLIFSDGVKSKKKNSSDSASAGGLIGRSDNTAVTISGVSVYGENAVILAMGSGQKEGSDYTDDSAGGLVGTIHNGSLAIDSCGVAAYVYAPNGDCAGGLVGDFSCSGSIRRSFAAALSDTDTASDGSVKSVFRNALAVDTDNRTVTQAGGYNVYGHLAVGGLVGYCNWNVEITNSFSTASVGIHASSSYSYRTGLFSGSSWDQLYFIGGMMGQLGTGSSNEKIVNCYLAGQAFDPSNGTRNIFIGSVLGYSMGSVDKHFYLSDSSGTRSVVCLTGMSFLDDGKMRFIGGMSNSLLTRSDEETYQSSSTSDSWWSVSKEKIYGIWHRSSDSIAAGTGTSAQYTEPMNLTALSGQSYPYMDYTHLYSPEEILQDNTEIESAPIRYYGDWCLERAE